ncbi:MAG TPA: hypothetical protein PKW90_27500, partial [Myxococcota bacterium]|nr:hypothetical protein [Myxococcota bacterium]
MGPAAEETRDYDAATGDIEQKAGSLWHYHCLTYFYTGMRRARRVVARARPPVDRRYLRPSAEKVETQWLGVGPAYNRYEVGSVLPRPPALPGDQARQGRYTLTLEAGKVLEEWQLGSDPKSGNDWELFGDGSPKSRLIWQDQVDEARQERRIDLMYDADGLVRGKDQVDRETPATTGTQLLYDAAGRLRYFRLGFVESNKWEQCYLRWDGLDRLVAVGFEPDPPVVLRDPSGRVIGLSDGQRWLRDGRRVVAAWKPAGSTGELFNPMVIVPDDDGEPLMIVRAPRDNFPSRAFLLVPQADGTPDAWMSSDGRVHSPGDALNNLNPQDVEHGAAVIDAGGQGPLEKPPLAPMHQPFGRF